MLPGPCRGIDAGPMSRAGQNRARRLAARTDGDVKGHGRADSHPRFRVRLSAQGAAKRPVEAPKAYAASVFSTSLIQKDVPYRIASSLKL